jgi:hypothetical protein
MFRQEKGSSVSRDIHLLSTAVRQLGGGLNFLPVDQTMAPSRYRSHTNEDISSEIGLLLTLGLVAVKKID